MSEEDACRDEKSDTEVITTIKKKIIKKSKKYDYLEEEK